MKCLKFGLSIAVKLFSDFRCSGNIYDYYNTTGFSFYSVDVTI